jgi:NADH-quinone oxidoreductase subunit L
VKREEEFHGVWTFLLHGVVSLPILLALAGIVTAWVLYMRKPDLPKRVARGFGPLYALVERKYGFDELYSWLFARGARALGKGFWRGGDQTVIDGLMVNGSARVVGWFSGVMRLAQSGLVNQYAVAMLIGVLILTFWFMRK